MIQFETRQLTIADKHQVDNIINENFTTVIDFSDKKFKHFTEKNGFEMFKQRTLKTQLNDIYYDFPYKTFGSFHNGELVSFVVIKIVNKDWVLLNLKTKKTSINRLRETMVFMFKTVLELGLQDYYCAIAEYRNEKFISWFERFIPEYHKLYDAQILETILAETFTDNSYEKDCIGYKTPLVNILSKKMIIKM